MSGRVRGAKPNIAIKTTDLKYEDYRGKDGRKKKKVKKSSDVDVTEQKDSFGVKIGIRVETKQEVDLLLWAGPTGNTVVACRAEEADSNTGVFLIAREMAQAFGGDEHDWRGFNATYLPSYGGSFKTKFKLQPIDNIGKNGFQILPVIVARVETDLTQGHYFVGASIVPGATSKGRAIRLGGKRAGKK